MSETLLKRQPSCFHYQDLVQKIMKDPDVTAFIQQESLDSRGIQIAVSPSLISTLPSVTGFFRGDTTILPKATNRFWFMNHADIADVSYEETPELITSGKEAAIKNRLKLINRQPVSGKLVWLKVDSDDLSRCQFLLKTISLRGTISSYSKGLYL